MTAPTITAPPAPSTITSGERQLVVDWYNGGRTVDPAALKALRVTGFIHKASEGATFKDGYFVANIAAMRASGGVVLGAYHFLLGDADPTAQAHNFLDQIAAVGGPEGLIIAVDVESEANHPDPTRDQAATFLEVLHANGVTQVALLYTGAWFWGRPGHPGHLGDPLGANIALLWDSAYVTGAGDPWAILGDLKPGQMTGPGVTPDYFNEYGGWALNTRPLRQYSSSAIIQGRATDVSVFYGSIDELAALAGTDLTPVPPIATPTAPPKPPIVMPPVLVRNPSVVVGIQQAIHVTADGAWGPVTDTISQLVRAAAHSHIPTPCKALQVAVGAVPDNRWGPISKADLQATIAAIQRALHVKDDGAWGPITDAAYVAARNANLLKH